VKLPQIRASRRRSSSIIHRGAKNAPGLRHGHRHHQRRSGCDRCHADGGIGHVSTRRLRAASGTRPGSASATADHSKSYSVKDGIVAHAGGTQAAAIADAASQVPAMNNRIATCATGGDSVVLPAAKPGMYVTVANDGAASCNVFPFRPARPSTRARPTRHSRSASPRQRTSSASSQGSGTRCFRRNRKGGDPRPTARFGGPFFIVGAVPTGP
jgi:hypothetical protein